ncbi:hypothetical protein MCOR27_009595 [Pyricularia oryzae]|uniref:Uncharacterized protein n=2 Tax=Pyricularia TaxID=48558 RepID=A0ABQ8N7D7_PYRGI|nr:hypothetical protein MCOR01_000623 [Pyricularia oryzae]KAI6292471.1 hypothetical protein MCOR33_009841 [Pyricularia grisea]KAH9428614.1 hypothetical protein MCOR02_011162 [Pyricularia oryzae]KAI6262857.1 hypothetical protein MCOR19_001025 [Pyricularia oryzae]KAI6269770.1 hypothetical protein MCOR27_009595 [Pyricularia oryzae]
MGSSQFNEKPQQSGQDGGEVSDQSSEQSCDEFHDAKTYQDEDFEEFDLLCTDIRGELARMVGRIEKDEASAIYVPIRRPANLEKQKSGKPTLEPETSKKL